MKKRKLPLPLPCFIIAAVCVIAMVVCLVVSSLLPKTLLDQRAAEFFAASAPVPEPVQAGAEETTSEPLRYSQVSAFLARGVGYNYSGFMTFRQSIAKKLESDGMIPASPTAHLWLDCASGEEHNMRLEGPARSNSSITATAIIGNFFYFHPTTILRGSIIDPDGAAKDVIMVDDQTAWDVFGGLDIVGQTAKLNGEPCIIGGVFKKEENDTIKNRIYVSFELLAKVVRAPELTVLEFVLPGPVTGYGLQVIYNESDNTGLLASLNSEDRIIVENSARFESSTLLKTLKDYDSLVMQTREIALPYWENSARLMTVRAAIYLIIAIVLAVFPAVVVVILLVKLFRQRGLFKPWAIERFKTVRKSLEAKKEKETAFEGSKNETEKK